MKGDSPKLFSSKGERDNVWAGEKYNHPLSKSKSQKPSVKDEGS